MWEPDSSLLLLYVMYLQTRSRHPKQRFTRQSVQKQGYSPNSNGTTTYDPIPIPIALPFTPPATPAPAPRSPPRVEIALGGISPTSVTNTVIKLAGVRSYNREITSMFWTDCGELGSTRR